MLLPSSARSLTSVFLEKRDDARRCLPEIEFELLERPRGADSVGQLVDVFHVGVLEVEVELLELGKLPQTASQLVQALQLGAASGGVNSIPLPEVEVQLLELLQGGDAPLQGADAAQLGASIFSELFKSVTRRRSSTAGGSPSAGGCCRIRPCCPPWCSYEDKGKYLIPEVECQVSELLELSKLPQQVIQPGEGCASKGDD